MTPFHTEVSFAPQWHRITRELTRKRLELNSRSRLITSTAVEPRGPNRRQNLWLPYRKDASSQQHHGGTSRCVPKPCDRSLAPGRLSNTSSRADAKSSRAKCRTRSKIKYARLCHAATKRSLSSERGSRNGQHGSMRMRPGEKQRAYMCSTDFA
jgi:hypothetical protein